jgi:integrase
MELNERVHGLRGLARVGDRAVDTDRNPDRLVGYLLAHASGLAGRSESSPAAQEVDPRQLDMFGATPAFPDVYESMARSGLRDSSLQRYSGAVKSWARYCDEHGEPMHDAQTITLIRWLDHRARESTAPKAAFELSLAAVRFVQRAHCITSGHESVPYTRRARMQLDAYARTICGDITLTKRARPLRLPELAHAVASARLRLYRNGCYKPSISSEIRRERDALMLLLGWWGALRADDLAKIQLKNVVFVPEGLELTIEDDKTASGAVIAIAQQPEGFNVCPVRAFRRLLQLPHGLSDTDPVFGYSTGNHCGRRIKAVFDRIGLPKGYTSHSLRSGFATECASQGVPDKLVQSHGRWRSAQQHSEYVRLGRLWVDTPTTRLSVRL